MNILREYKRIIYAYFLFKEFTKLKCWVILGWFDQSRLCPDHCRDVVVGEIHLFILKSIQVPFSLPICVQADYIPIQKQPTCSMYKICIRNCTQNYPYMHGYTWNIWGRSFAGILAGGYTKATHGLWSWTRALIWTTPHKMWSICVTRVFSHFPVLNVICYDLFKLVSIFLYGQRDVFKLEYPNRHAVKWSNIDDTHTD